MAVYPQRIVLKNSADGDASVQGQIRSGGAGEIVDGEVVISQRPGAATLFTRDSSGAIVAIGAQDTAVSYYPRIFDDFEGGSNVTPSTGNSPDEDSGMGGVGTHAIKMDDDWEVSAEYGIGVGYNPWTIELWIKGDPSTSEWPVDVTSGSGDAPFVFIMGMVDNYVGPGSFNVYLDGGLQSEGGLGTSTSNSSSQAFGSICFGLNPGFNYTHEDPSIPVTGEVVTSRSTSVLDNNWHHVVFQHEGKGSYCCFVDGVLIERKKLQRAIDHNNIGDRTDITPPQPFAIGKEFENTGAGTTRNYPVHPELYIDSFAIWENVAKHHGRHEYVVPTGSVAYELVGQPSETLQNLFDTNVSNTIADGSVLVWDDVNGYWRTQAAPAADISGNNLGQLGNVTLDADGLITDGEMLAWSATNSQWENTVYLLDNANDLT